MDEVRRFLRDQGRGWLPSAAVFCLCPLLPEYCVPVVCLAAYARTLYRCRTPLVRTEKAEIVYMLWMLLGVLWSGARVTALSILFLWGFFFLAGRTVIAGIRTKEQLDALLYGGAISGGCAGAVGIVQMILFHYGAQIWKPLRTLFNPFWHPLDTAAARLFLHILPEQFMPLLQRRDFIAIHDRASGTFTNPVFYAVFLCMMLPLCAYGLFYFHARRRRIVSLICLALAAGGIAVSYSRGPYLAVAVLFFVLLFYGARPARRLLAMGGGFLVLLLLTGAGVYRRLLTLLRTDDISVNTRSHIWRVCREMLRGHWLFGYGTGIGNVRRMLHDTYGIPQPHAHNLFLQILLENGAVGLALFAVILVLFAVRAVQLYRRGGKARGVGVTLLASAAGFCACGMTDYLFYGLKPICIFLMLLAAAECAAALHLPHPEPAESAEPLEQRIPETV